MIGIKKVGVWNKARRTLFALPIATKKALPRAVQQEAQLFRTLVVMAFTSGGRSNGIVWPKLRPETTRKKGSSKPLIDTGELRNSIVVIKDSTGAFIGVPSNATRSDGKGMISIAAVHEYGAVIDREGYAIVLPSRSFLQSTFDAHFKANVVQKRMLGRIAFITKLPGVTAPPSARALAAVARAKVKNVHS